MQVLVGEPSVPDTVQILRGLKERYASHHGVNISDRALVMAAELADRYITNRFLPGGWLGSHAVHATHGGGAGCLLWAGRQLWRACMKPSPQVGSWNDFHALLDTLLNQKTSGNC